uniref:Myb-like domain-containing protein n=1 Tax=Davidia involucrata TaxID=16924 RepID=A0A5B7AGL5_DAVIN
MAAKPSSASTLPWIWVIETLASSAQVDASCLIDLIERTPEIVDDLGRNAREMVSLRILESLFVERNRLTSGVSSTPNSKIGFDQSERCEDVLRRICCEISASNLKIDGTEMLNWDVEPFIMHKRACLPKCVLQQLKDEILKGSNPILASLKERSGLAIRDQYEDRILVDDGDLNAIAGRLQGSGTDGQIVAAQGNIISSTTENQDGILQEDSPDKKLLPSKRDRSDLATENLVTQFHKDRICMDYGHDPHLHAAKKIKQDVTCTSQAIGQNSVPLHGNELLEDSSGRIGQLNGREGCDLATGSQVGGLEESRFSEGDHDKHIALKRLGQSNDVGDDNIQHNHAQISYNNKKITQDTSGDGQHQNISVDEAKDDNEHFAEMGSNGAPPDVTHQNISFDEARGNCEHSSQLNISNGAPPDGSHWEKFADKAKDDMEHNGELEMSSNSDEYNDEKIDVAMKKHSFLSSQCAQSQDSLATADLTELNLCMKCNKSGQLLVCSTSSCPLVVHENCLGSAAIFDDGGNFYCPFCAYSRAILKYLEVKKKASLARKELAAFIGLGNEHQPKKLSKRLRSGRNHLRQDGGVDGNNEAKEFENHVNKVNNPQWRTNIEDKRQAEPLASCVNVNLPCGEQGITVINGPLCALPEDNQEGEKMGQDQECQSARVLEGQDIEIQVDHRNGGDNSSCRDTEIVHARERHAEVGVQQDVLQQPITDSPHKAACQPNIDAEESSEEDNDNSTASNYSIRFRKREKQYTYPAIPQLRRKKVPWTQVEEEILKEGVRRFSSIHDRSIPWKKILEFGSNVFQKGRTTIDLKDKWRNICRSPKSK